MRTNRRLIQVHRDIFRGDLNAKQPKVFLKQDSMESADCEPISALCRSSPAPLSGNFGPSSPPR
jgi:hypothetical protein